MALNGNARTWSAAAAVTVTALLLLVSPTFAPTVPERSSPPLTYAPQPTFDIDEAANERLFDLSELPEPQRPESVIPAPDPFTDLRAILLVGVVIADQAKSALLRTPPAGRIMTLEEGGVYRGLTLVRISARSVAFERNGDVFEISMINMADVATAGDGDRPRP